MKQTSPVDVSNKAHFLAGGVESGSGGDSVEAEFTTHGSSKMSYEAVHVRFDDAGPIPLSPSEMVAHRWSKRVRRDVYQCVELSGGPSSASRGMHHLHGFTNALTPRPLRLQCVDAVGVDALQFRASPPGRTSTCRFARLPATSGHGS